MLRDGDALLLTAGELDATLADDGVVLVFEYFGKFIDARDAAGGENFGFGRLRPRKRDVFTDGAVERKVSCRTTPSWVR